MERTPDHPATSRPPGLMPLAAKVLGLGVLGLFVEACLLSVFLMGPRAFLSGALTALSLWFYLPPILALLAGGVAVRHRGWKLSRLEFAASGAVTWALLFALLGYKDPNYAAQHFSIYFASAFLTGLGCCWVLDGWLPPPKPALHDEATSVSISDNEVSTEVPMNEATLLRVGVRLLGLWLAVEALVRLPFLWGVLASSRAVSNEYSAVSLLQGIAHLLSILFSLAAGVFLLRTEKLLARFAPKGGTEAVSLRLSLAVGIRLLALYVLLTYGTKAVAALLWGRTAELRMAGEILPGVLLTVALASLLFAFAPRIARWCASNSGEHKEST